MATTTESNVQTDIAAEEQAFSDWNTAHAATLNAQAAAASAAASEAAKLASLTGDLTSFFTDAVTVVAGKLSATGQNPRAVLAPLFDAVVPPAA